MRPIEVICAATRNGADLLGQQDLGRLKPGARADVIAVAKGALQDVAALLDVQLVMKDGVVVKTQGRLPRCSSCMQWHGWCSRVYDHATQPCCA